MAIIYPLALPTLGIKEITITPVNIVGASASPFTGQEQVYKHPGEWWEADMTLSQMNRDKAEPWIAVMTALRGRFGTFLLGDPSGVAPRGAVSGNPVVNGAGQSGSAVAVRSLPVSTLVFCAGDYIQLGNGASARLHKVLQDVISNASGQATLDIWPSLRVSPTDGQPVIYQNTVGVFRLASNKNPFTYVSPQIASIMFSAREAI